MIARLIIAVVVAFIVTLKFAPAVIIGDVLITWGYAIAVCIGIWYFFFGYLRWNPLAGRV